VPLTELPFQLLVSIFLGLTAWLTRSLWPCIVGHALWDLLLQPVFAFHYPRAAWALLSAKPVWQSKAGTFGRELEAIWAAANPVQISHGITLFAVCVWLFLLSAVLSIFAFPVLGRAANRAHRET
jgi:hypothetical protein